jgi:hypothetical protein
MFFNIGKTKKLNNKLIYLIILLFLMEKYQYCILIPVLITLFGVGIWEAHIASKNQPNNVHFTYSEKEAYAFTVIKSIINILTCIGGFCIDFKLDKEDETKNKNKITCINIGIGLWCIVMYFQMIHDKSLFGSFNKIITAEFFISIIILSCFIFISIIKKEKTRHKLLIEHDELIVSSKIITNKTKNLSEIIIH